MMILIVILTVFRKDLTFPLLFVLTQNKTLSLLPSTSLLTFLYKLFPPLQIAIVNTNPDTNRNFHPSTSQTTTTTTNPSTSLLLHPTSTLLLLTVHLCSSPIMHNSQLIKFQPYLQSLFP